MGLVQIVPKLVHRRDQVGHIIIENISIDSEVTPEFFYLQLNLAAVE